MVTCLPDNRILSYTFTAFPSSRHYCCGISTLIDRSLYKCFSITIALHPSQSVPSTMKSYIILAAVCFSGLALSAPNNYPTTTTTTTTKTTTTTTSSYYPEQTYCTKGQKFTRTTYDVNVSTQSSQTRSTTPNKARQFDNIPSIPGVANNPIPSPYDQLYFQSWVNDDIIQSGVAPGTVPHSPPSKIATGANLQIQQGQPLFSTIYQNSNTTAFDLFSFYYDCQATTPEGVLGVPMQCDVIVTGYRGEHPRSLETQKPE